MWPSIKRWHDWAMHNLWPFSRSSPHSQTLHYSFERAGLTLSGQPIPWTADSVLVEALVRQPGRQRANRNDFLLRLPGREPSPAEHLRRVEDGDLYRITFRLPPPPATVTADVLFRDRLLGQLSLPVLSRSEFLEGLRLDSATLFVRLGPETVACQTFVPAQCRGLLATGMLISRTSLVPLLDMDLQVEFHCERDGTTFRVPACLTCSQLTGRSALVTVVPPRYPKRIGVWTTTWLVGDHVLARQRIRGISQRHFHKSLRISDTRFIVQKTGSPLRLSVQPPALEETARIGPCFMVASNEPGMAGVCQLQVTAQVSGARHPPLLMEQQVRITDGPTVVAPGTLEVGELQQVTGFEVSVAGQSLGVLSLCPVPEATFTSEGGFRTPADYTWSAAAEEEMTERLNRLFEGQLPNE
jgi:hypothetical protein